MPSSFMPTTAPTSVLPAASVTPVILSSSDSEHKSDHESENTLRRKKQRGTYHTYTFSMKLSVVKELATTPIIVLSKKYNIPRSTILFLWENQMRRKNTKVPLANRGAHLCSENGRNLSRKWKKFVLEMEEICPTPMK